MAKKRQAKQKTTKRQRNLPRLIFGLTVLAIISSLVTFYFLANSKTKNNPKDAIAPTTDLTTTSSPPPKETPPSQDEPTTPAIPDKHHPQNEGDDPNLSATLTGTITFANKIDQDLKIYTVINQIISEGSCELSLTSGDKTIFRQSGIVANPSSSSCQIFSIPLTELGSNKNWSIKIKISDQTRQGTIKKEVNLE